MCFLIIVRLAGDNYKFAPHNYSCVEDKPKKTQTVFLGGGDDEEDCFVCFVFINVICILF